MKSKKLLLLLLALIFAPWAANAQTLTVCDGTENSSVVPFDGYNADAAQHNQMIFPATDLTAMNGKNLTQMVFYIDQTASNGTYTAPNRLGTWTVSLGETTETTLSGLDNTTALTQVYQGYFDCSTGTLTLAFENDYTYHGGNLLVDLNHAASSWNRWYFLGVTATGASYTYGSQRNFLPKTTFSYETPSAFPKPTQLAVSNVLHNSATLSWTENGPATAWQIGYTANGGTEQYVSVTENPYTLTGLSPLTTYEVRVQSDYQDNTYSVFSNPISFSTTAVAEAVGDAWSDDFEGETCGWDLVNGTLTNQWVWGTAVNNGGSHAIYVSNDNGATNNYSASNTKIFATKLLNFTDGKFEFTYDWRCKGESTWDFLRVALVPASQTLTAGTDYSTITQPGLPTGWIALDGGKLNLQETWQSKDVTINVAAGNYYLVLAWRNDSGVYPPAAAVDNVSITKIACDQDVTDLAVSNITTTNATLTWDGGEAREWQVAYGTANSFEGATEVIVDANTYDMTGLQSSSTYYVKVRAYCGGEDFGTWSDVFSFATACDVIPALGYSENFDSYTAGNNVLPTCWSYINTTTNSTYAVYPRVYANSSYTTYASSAPNCLYLYSYGSSDPQPQYAILPEMTGLAGLQVTLMAKGYNASSTLKIGTMSDPTDATTFTMIAEQTLTTSYPTEPFEFIIPADCRDSYLAIMIDAAPSGYNTRGVYVDDIVIREAPTCVKPTDLAFVSATTTTATLSWTETGRAEAWQICLNGDEENLITADRNPFTLEGLTASTVYTAKVRAYCDADNQSDWSNQISFATECDAISTLPWSENFDAYTGSTSTSAPSAYPNDQLPNCWQFLNRSETTSDYPQAFLTSSTTYAVSGNCLFFKSSSTTPLYAILPGFAEEIAGLQLTFTYRNEGTGTSNGQLIAGYMTNPADATTFVEVLTCDRTTTLTEKEVLFADAPAGSYIAFKYQGGSANNYYLSIDNVSVDYAPSCPKPQSLAVTANSVTAHGATVTWTEAGEATQWIVEFATDADFTDVLNETVNDEPTYTFHGLDPETTYYVRVKAHCGAGNESQYSNVVNFTTDEACKVPTGLTVSNVTVNTATLSWTESGESASWQICLNDDEENLINANTNPYTLEGLTAETAYTAKVRGYCNEAYTDWSSSVSFEPTAKLVIGSGTGTTSYLPSNTNYDFSYTQQIYTVAELGEAGVIESIDFYMTSTTDYDRDLDIYMVSTDKSSFTNNTDWIAVTDANLVFSGNVSFTAQSWTTITLDEGFIYNGTQNVAIIVDDNSNKWSSRSFRSFTVEANQSIYKYRDDTDIPITFAESGTLTTSKNQIRILKSEMSDCMKPTQFTATEVGPDFAVLDWTENGASESWYIFYQEITPVIGEYESIEVFEHPYTLTGLNNEKPYYAFVVPSCGVESGYPDNSLVSHTIEFTTLPGCPAPLDVELSNITHNSVDVTWTGFNDSYYVRIENNSGYSETYENAESPLTIENLEGSTPYQVIVLGLCGDDMIEVAADPVLFVTPCTPYTITETAPYTQDFEAPVVTTTYSGIGEMPSCWDNYPVNVSASAKILAAGAQYNYAEEGQVLYFYGSGNNYAALPEFTNALNTLQISFKWATESSSNGTLTLGYITAQDEDYNTFTVIKTFAASSESYRTLKAETVGLGNLPETATRLVFRWYYSGQWGCNIDDVEVALMPTFTKEIDGYHGNAGGYYLIASPLAAAVDPTTVNMITDNLGVNANPETSTYDLYRFDEALDLEWVNYRGHENDFSLVNGQAYLYASKNGTTLTFTGTPYTGDGKVILNRTDSETADFQGWNLVGNPFADTAYIDRPFYVMDENGAEIIAEENMSRPIPPMEGIFVIADNDGEEMTFSQTAPTGSKASIALNLTQGRGNTIDRAIVCVGQGHTLPKFMLNPNNTKLYIPQNGEDYAVVRSRVSDEIPVSFVPAEDGYYNISVDVRNMNLRSLILKDYVRNVSIDLLRTPTYQFKASVYDRADRFVLVFRTSNSIYKEKIVKGGNPNDFCFYSNGVFVIDNEAEATLQVIDLNGRVLSSETIYGSTSVQVDAAPGVYMLRLVNGNDVKVQKVVVR